MSEVTTDQYYHQLRQAESQQSILLLEIGDDSEPNIAKNGISQPVQDEDEELEYAYSNPMAQLLPFQLNKPQDDLNPSEDQLELDELESQYQLQSSQYQHPPSSGQLYDSQDPLNDFVDEDEEFEEHFQPSYVTNIGEQFRSVSKESIDLHRAFQRECHNLDCYFDNLGQQELTKNNVLEITAYINNLRDLYITFLIDYVDQKYQIISLQETLMEKSKDNNTQQNNNNDKQNFHQQDIHSSNVATSEISVSEETNNSNEPKLNKKGLNHILSSVKSTPTQHQDKYVKPWILILKNTAANIADEHQLCFKSQKQMIESQLEPKKNGIGIKSIGPTKQGGVVLSFYSERERKLAFDILIHKVEELNLHVTIPNTIYPKMLIHSIGNHWNIGNLKTTLIKQNKEIEEAYNNGEMFDIIFLSKDGDVTIKVSPFIRNHLKRKGRICANLASFKVSDRLFVKRCYKCHQFGHFSSRCRYIDQVCGHCNENHKFNDCPHKDDQRKSKCINCLKSKFYKNKANHRPSDPDCPSLHYEHQRIVNKTDYGSDGY